MPALESEADAGALLLLRLSRREATTEQLSEILGGYGDPIVVINRAWSRGLIVRKIGALGDFWQLTVKGKSAAPTSAGSAITERHHNKGGDAGRG